MAKKLIDKIRQAKGVLGAGERLIEGLDVSDFDLIKKDALKTGNIKKSLIWGITDSFTFGANASEWFTDGQFTPDRQIRIKRIWCNARKIAGSVGSEVYAVVSIGTAGIYGRPITPPENPALATGTNALALVTDSDKILDDINMLCDVGITYKFGVTSYSNFALNETVFQTAFMEYEYAEDI